MDEIKVKRRRFNNLTDYEDVRRNLARYIRKAEKGLMPWKDVAAATTAFRALMEAIEKSEGTNTLKEVETLLLKLRSDLDALKKREEAQ